MEAVTQDGSSCSNLLLPGEGNPVKGLLMGSGGTGEEDCTRHQPFRAKRWLWDPAGRQDEAGSPPLSRTKPPVSHPEKL